MTPNSQLSIKRIGDCYRDLGFLRETSLELVEFKKAVTTFLKAKNHRLHIIPWDHTVGFDRMVEEFLQEHGSEFWPSQWKLGEVKEVKELTYPEHREEIRKGVRNLLANKIRNHNQSRGISFGVRILR